MNQDVSDDMNYDVAFSTDVADSAFYDAAAGWPRPGEATASSTYASQWEAARMLTNDYDLTRPASLTHRQW